MTSNIYGTLLSSYQVYTDKICQELISRAMYSIILNYMRLN